MSKGFWIALTFIFAVAFSSLSLYTYSKDVLLKANREYSLEDYLGTESDECITTNEEY